MQHFFEPHTKLVLIETSWNVKMYESVREQLPDERINRNIVECKDKHSSRKNKSPYRINRNIVECKVGLYDLSILV